MAFKIVNHPIANECVGVLRNKETSTAEFRRYSRLLADIVLLKAFETLPAEVVSVDTPVAPQCKAKKISSNVVFVPILRAGLALLDPAINLLPQAKVGYFGLQRNEETALPEFYYQKIPNLNQADVFILDPMLATGGSAAFACREILKHNIRSLSLVSIIAAQAGVDAITHEFPNVDVYTTALDPALNEKYFIVPGLGDFGDRFHGTI